MAAAETKTRLLDAAEKLFSEHGFAATSLRAITAEAGANLAAVNYHFGSKEALVRAVFDRRIGPLNEERLRLLGACERTAGGAEPDLRCVLRALISPFARLVQESSVSGVEFVRLLGRAHFEPDPALRRLVAESFREVFRRFADVLERCVTDLPRRELVSRLFFAVGAMTVIADIEMFTSIADDERGRRGAEVEELDTLVDQMVLFLETGFRRAPTPPEAREGRPVSESWAEPPAEEEGEP